jgi:hypothetical protein
MNVDEAMKQNQEAGAVAGRANALQARFQKDHG